MTNKTIANVHYDVRPPQITDSRLYEQKSISKQQWFLSWPPITHLPDRLFKQEGYTKRMKLVTEAMAIHDLISITNIVTAKLCLPSQSFNMNLMPPGLHTPSPNDLNRANRILDVCHMHSECTIENAESAFHCVTIHGYIRGEYYFQKFLVNGTHVQTVGTRLSLAPLH